MRSKHPLQWQVLEDDSDWDRANGLDDLLPDSALRPHLRSYRTRLVILLAIVIAVGMGAVWLRRQAVMGLDHVEESIAEAVVLEGWATAPARRDAVEWLAYGGNEDGRERATQPQHLLLELSLKELRDDLALVEVVLSDSQNDSSLHEHRVYRETAAGWQRTTPVAALWGERRTLESEHFIFHYRRIDENAVTEAALQLDALYRQIEGNFGLASSVGPDKLVVQIDEEATPSIDLLQGFQDEYIVVASPKLFLLPDDLSESALLVQTVTLPLVTSMVNRAISAHALTDFPLMRSGLRLWQLWQLSGPLTEWRSELIAWLYGDSTSPPTANGRQFPSRYAEMCQLFNTWKMRPDSFGIPVSCTQTDILFLQTKRAPVCTLAQLTPEYTHQPDFSASRPSTCLGTVAWATLFDHMVTAYGYPQLPVLLENLAQFDEWDRAIHHTLNITVAEFEQGWQLHVQAIGTGL